MSNNESDTFELILKSATKLPMVRINREDFLRKELIKYCYKEQVDKAITDNPAFAGINSQTINKIAKECINLETNKVSAISFVTGLPGSFAMIGTIPADIAQYYAHVLRILQELIYLYGWQELFNDEDMIDDGTTNILAIFLGVMFGVEGAAKALIKLSESAGRKITKDLIKMALTKGTIYPIVKKIVNSLGGKMTKEIFAKGVGKAVPVIGGVVSGGITYITFRSMAMRLKAHLSELNLADTSFYTSSYVEM